MFHPKCLSLNEHNIHVVVIIFCRLSHRANAPVGNAVIRGISGGEKRRLSVGVEMGHFLILILLHVYLFTCTVIAVIHSCCLRMNTDCNILHLTVAGHSIIIADQPTNGLGKKN